MLKQVIIFKKPIIHYSKHHVPKQKKLDDTICSIVTIDDFQIIKILAGLLRPLYILTDISSRKNISSSYWNQILREINNVFNKYLKSHFNQNFLANCFNNLEASSFQKCAKCSLRTLEKYNDATLKSDDLFISHFLTL